MITNDEDHTLIRDAWDSTSNPTDMACLYIVTWEYCQLQVPHQSCYLSIMQNSICKQFRQIYSTKELLQPMTIISLVFHFPKALLYSILLPVNTVFETDLIMPTEIIWNMYHTFFTSQSWIHTFRLTALWKLFSVYFLLHIIAKISFS